MTERRIRLRPTFLEMEREARALVFGPLAVSMRAPLNLIDQRLAGSQVAQSRRLSHLVRMKEQRTLEEPRDVLRWILDMAIAANAPLHPGQEFDLTRPPPDRSEEANVDRYVAEGQHIQAAVRSCRWIEPDGNGIGFGFMLTEEGCREVERLKQFRDATEDAGDLVELAVEPLVERFAAQLGRIILVTPEIPRDDSGEVLRTKHRTALTAELGERRRVTVARLVAIGRVLQRVPSAIELEELDRAAEHAWFAATKDLRVAQLKLDADSLTAEDLDAVRICRAVRLELRSAGAPATAAQGGITNNFSAAVGAVQFGAGSTAIVSQGVSSEELTKMLDRVLSILGPAAGEQRREVSELRELAARGVVAPALSRVVIARVREVLETGAHLGGTALLLQELAVFFARL